MLVIAAAGFAPLLPPSARVGVAQRVVHAVGVAVEALCSGGVVNESIDGEERAHHWVVHAPVHVDEADMVIVLMQGVAAAEGCFDRLSNRGIAKANGVAAAAPSVVAQPLHGVAVDGGRQAALVVFQGIVHRASSVILRDKDSKQSRCRGQIMQLFCHAVFSIRLFLKFGCKSNTTVKHCQEKHGSDLFGFFDNVLKTIIIL